MQKNQKQLRRKENVGTYLTMAKNKQVNLERYVYSLT